MLNINEKGQTLIEVIVAILLCALILVGVTKLIASSFSNVDFSENQVNASNLAQEGIAAIGGLHDTDYATFKNYVLFQGGLPTVNGFTAIYCLPQVYDVTNMPVGPCTIANALVTVNNNKYIRSITLENDTTSGKCIGNVQATVNVQWNDKDCGSTQYCHSSQLISCYGPAL